MMSGHDADKTNTYAAREHFHGQQDAWQKARNGGLAAALVGCVVFWAIMVALFAWIF